jgi:hypothetical protein
MRRKKIVLHSQIYTYKFWEKAAEVWKDVATLTRKQWVSQIVVFIFHTSN